MMEIMVLQALASYRLGQLEAALEILARAVAMAEPGGSIRLFVEPCRTMSDLGDPMTVLLERLNQAQTGHTYTQRVLASCRTETLCKTASDPDARKGSRLSGQPPVQLLTPRETDLLLLLAEGLSNKEIAANLHIAPETVKTHLQNIYRKLDAKGRMAALKAARKLGFVAHD